MPTYGPDETADYPIDGEPADRAAWQADALAHPCAPRCRGCAGTGVIPVRIQTRLNGQRFCYATDQPCPICAGLGVVTQAEADAWFAREFPEVKEPLP